MSRVSPWIFLPAFALAACGTEVDVGANREAALAARAAQENADDASEDPIVVDATGQPISGSDDATAANNSGTGGAALTCFGAAPTLTPSIEAFCAISDATLRTNFAQSFQKICDERRLFNLFLKPCGWTGTGASEKFRRVISKTAISDEASQDFAFYAAYALTTESGLEAQTALAKGELEDPNYAARFVTIKNSRVFDLTKNADGTYNYTAEFASSSATVKFRAHVVFMQLTPDLTVVFDYAVSDRVVIKEHRFLRFIQRVDADHSRVVAIDEKLVTDGGNHALAYQNLTDVLRQRMERDYENSRRD